MVYSFRGTRLHHSSNLAADYHVLADRDQDLVIVQKAVQHIGLVQVKLRVCGVVCGIMCVCVCVCVCRAYVMCTSMRIQGYVHVCMHSSLLYVDGTSSLWYIITTVPYLPPSPPPPNPQPPHQAAYPDVQLCQYTTGHSLGGFTATACTVLLREIHHCVAFECPGLTSYYHSAAAAACGNEDVWKVGRRWGWVSVHG